MDELLVRVRRVHGGCPPHYAGSAVSVRHGAATREILYSCGGLWGSMELWLKGVFREMAFRGARLAGGRIIFSGVPRYLRQGISVPEDIL